MKINKYSIDKTQHNLKSKLRSYSTMAAAFMVAGGVHAQCGTVGSANPQLLIDIDGDGTNDMNIRWGGAGFGTAGASFLPVADVNILNTVAGTLSASFYVGFNFQTYGCQAASIPAYYGAGYGGGAFFNGNPAWGSYTTVNATTPISLEVNAVSVYQFSAFLFLTQRFYAFALGSGNNQIVGLTASGASICSAIDSSPGVTGGGFLALGSVFSSALTYGYSLVAFGLEYMYAAGSTCSTYGYLGTALTFPPVPGLALSSSFTLSGSVELSPYTTSMATQFFPNTNPTRYIGIQFLSGGETHNGWVEISIDPNTSEITCLGTGYQQCSIETAIANSGNASNACIATGEATNESAACTGEVAEIPTLSEWSLLILGLMMSITAVVGIRQRREEEEMLDTV